MYDELREEIYSILNDLVQDVGMQITRDYEWKHGIWEGTSIDNVEAMKQASKRLEYLWCHSVMKELRELDAKRKL